MGQILKLMADQLVCFDYNYVNYNHSHSHRYYGEHSEERSDDQGDQALPDLSEWPPELSLEVLKNLNATDLSLAGCVWTELARDQVLWHSLSCSQWGYVSIYLKAKSDNFSYHKLYLQLDEGSVTFNADCHMGMDYFFRHGLLDNNPAEIASFFLAAKPLDKSQMRRYLKSRPEVLDQVIDSQNFSNQFLAQALRHLFALVEAPDKRDHYLHLMLDKFAHRFSNCNPQLGLNPDVVYVLCFSLIMLSVDLSSPHIKNKMSKREFIRNVRHAIHRVDDELYGHLYDDIYLKGHIAVT